MASSSEFPLTDFMVNMMKANNDQIKRACPVKMAKKYGIREQDARELLLHEMMMRGMYNERAAKIAGK